MSDLPASVSAAIDAAYPGFSPEHDADLLTLADGSTQYQLELRSPDSNGSGEHEHKDISILVAADGTILCEQTE